MWFCSRGIMGITFTTPSHLIDSLTRSNRTHTRAHAHTNSSQHAALASPHKNVKKWLLWKPRSSILKCNSTTLVYYYQCQIYIFLVHRQNYDAVAQPNSFFFLTRLFLLNSLLFNLPRIAIIWSAFINSAPLLEFLETLISLRRIKAARLPASLCHCSPLIVRSCFFLTSFHRYVLCMIHFFSFSLHALRTLHFRSSTNTLFTDTLSRCMSGQVGDQCPAKTCNL